MRISKYLGVVVAVGALVIGSGAQAGGSKGGGSAAAPSHSASSSSQGIGSNSWSGSPPGWGKAEESKGWDSGQQPPGWDNNTIGKEHGWGANSATTPGLEKR